MPFRTKYPTPEAGSHHHLTSPTSGPSSERCRLPRNLAPSIKGGKRSPPLLSSRSPPSPRGRPMAAAEALDFMEQIQSLVADRLQVVSYKWLSRNFSVASNDAKRMLQNFVEKHGNKLEVVYALSGWLEDDPHTYQVKLVPAVKLSEAKKEFKDYCSVQVYSVQACIPKDPAVLWNAEFVQAEELFDQPTTVDNCLRDNRFCAILNSSVKRNIDIKHGVSSGVSKSHMGTSTASKTNSSIRNLSAQPYQEEKTHQITSNSSMQFSSVRWTEGKSSIGASNKVNVDKEKHTVVPTSKLKNQNDRPQVNGGSLATLWACASTKQNRQPPATESINDGPASTCDGVKQPSAHESLVTCNENMEQNCGSGRKRKVVFDFSDDEAENEDVVSLASPEPPARHSVPDCKGNNDGAHASSQTKNASSHEQNYKIEQDKKENDIMGVSTAVRLGDDTKIKSRTIVEKSQAYSPEGSAEDKAVGNVKPALPKRKKVLKTRIDERGREDAPTACFAKFHNSGYSDLLVDSEASKHLCGDACGLRQLQPLQGGLISWVLSPPLQTYLLLRGESVIFNAKPDKERPMRLLSARSGEFSSY